MTCTVPIVYKNISLMHVQYVVLVGLPSPSSHKGLRAKGSLEHYT